MDRVLFEKQYGLIYKDLYRFALYTLGSREDAEDVVSEAVTDAYGQMDKLKNDDAFKTWIFKILTAKCKRKLKEYVNKTVELDETLPQLSSGHEKKAEEAEDIRKAFAALNSQERLIVSMSVWGGYNSREIGKSLHLNDATVRSKLSRALDKMQKRLEA